MDKYTEAAAEWFDIPVGKVTLDQRQDMVRFFGHIGFGDGHRLDPKNKITPERKRLLGELYREHEPGTANMLKGLRSWPYDD